ncbi:MAG: helix-turn-helix transcriptional regulator [Lachnospiraceae bacterium]|nr:helix-turn-helix transcriptional regulator [Lachnospiraceae bacterium]
MNQENIGKFIAKLRKEKKLTQEQLAEKLGVNNRSVSRWENGTCMPDYALLPLLAQELGISVAELVEGKRTEANSYFLRETAYMDNYRILMEVSRKVTLGEKNITEEEKQEIVEVLLNGVACKDDVKKYKLRMRVNPFTDTTYPNYFIPPYNGNKKLRLADGSLPKTHILYANYFELEILRILFQFAPENEMVQEMITNTLQRLKNTCYGNNCPKGECVATGKEVLCFLQIVCPEEKDWIEKLQ